MVHKCHDFCLLCLFPINQIQTALYFRHHTLTPTQDFFVAKSVS